MGVFKNWWGTEVVVTGTTRNRLAAKVARGFESHLHRNIVLARGSLKTELF